MKLEWNDLRCIRCAQERTLTEEHLIPQAVGGKLSCEFLCKPCNDQLGQVEADFRDDPAVRHAIEKLKLQIPALWRTMSEGRPYIMKSRGGSVRAKIIRGEFRANPSSQGDSLIHPISDAAGVIRTILMRRGADAAQIAHAVSNFDEAPENLRVSIADGIEVVKWTVTDIHPTLDGPSLNPLVPLKIAYEYLALHCGLAIFDPSLSAVREALGTGGHIPDVCGVEELRSLQYHPFHGLVVEDTSGHVAVQIRLFGYLVYRVHFFNVRLAKGPFVAYTLQLETGQEHLCEVCSGRIRTSRGGG